MLNRNYKRPLFQSKRSQKLNWSQPFQHSMSSDLTNVLIWAREEEINQNSQGSQHPLAWNENSSFNPYKSNHSTVSLLFSSLFLLYRESNFEMTNLLSVLFLPFSVSEAVFCCSAHQNIPVIWSEVLPDAGTASCSQCRRLNRIIAA